MTSSPVSIELLDSMLGGSQQNAAEKVYRSIPLPNRVQQLSSLLAQLHTTNAAAASSNNDAGRSMLAAVLLRRDISSLATSPNSVSLMGEIAEPLLSLFCHDDGGAANKSSTRRQIGHCIAELCGSLSLASPADGREWMKTLLGRLEPGVSYISCVSSIEMLYAMAMVQLHM